MHPMNFGAGQHQSTGALEMPSSASSPYMGWMYGGAMPSAVSNNDTAHGAPSHFNSTSSSSSSSNHSKNNNGGANLAGMPTAPLPFGSGTNNSGSSVASMSSPSSNNFLPSALSQQQQQQQPNNTNNSSQQNGPGEGVRQFFAHMQPQQQQPPSGDASQQPQQSSLPPFFMNFRGIPTQMPAAASVDSGKGGGTSSSDSGGSGFASGTASTPSMVGPGTTGPADSGNGSGNNDSVPSSMLNGVNPPPNKDSVAGSYSSSSNNNNLSSSSSFTPNGASANFQPFGQSFAGPSNQYMPGGYGGSPKGAMFAGSYYGQPVFVMMPPDGMQQQQQSAGMMPQWSPHGAAFVPSGPMNGYPMQYGAQGNGPFMGVPQNIYGFPGAPGGPIAVQKRRRKRRKSNRCSSKYRGVSWHKRDHRWVARAWVNGKTENLGTFISEKHAALMVDSKLIEAYGPTAEALLNFPDPKEREEVAQVIEKEIQLELERERERERERGRRRSLSPDERRHSDNGKDQSSSSGDSGSTGKDGRDSSEADDKNMQSSSGGEGTSKYGFSGSNFSTEGGSDGDSGGTRSQSGARHKSSSKTKSGASDDSVSDDGSAGLAPPVKKRVKTARDQHGQKKVSVGP